jgi:23S rRNA pseudouridine2605 synthase
MERLQKYLARAGVASRRHAEGLITAGRVKVNNQRVTELGVKVEAGKDLVTVDGELVAPTQARAYYILYKPPGVVTTLSDPQGRPTVGSLLEGKVKERVFPVGRLDYDAEGALLLTNDGELANTLMHPRYQVRRTYLAKVKGAPLAATLEKLRGGVRLEDGPFKPTSAEVFESAEKNTWLKLVVTEGRPHLIKRLCAAVGHPVVRLFRPFHASVGVEGLEPGRLRRLNAEEVVRVQSVGAGEKVTDPLLRLPARRHGKGPWGGEGGESEEGSEAPRAQARPRAGKTAPRPGKSEPRAGNSDPRANRRGFSAPRASNAPRGRRKTRS